MCAPSTSASVIMMILLYRACSMSKLAPDPAPTTWMMAAHSLLDSICASLGCAQCGITLDDEQFGHIVIAGLAVGQFRRHGRGFKRVLTACDFLGLARLHAGMHFADDFLQHAAGLFLVTAFGAGNHLTELLIGHSGDDRLARCRARPWSGLGTEVRRCGR